VATVRSRRERFPWFPTINREVCLSDLVCLNFCPAGVFDWDPATGKPVVARPLDCIPGCRSCAENCKAKGISLPGRKEVLAALKRIRAEDHVTSPPGEGQGMGPAMPRGSNKALNLFGRPGRRRKSLARAEFRKSC
jgi:NAD-dependent dihydropyrimidine dehydrogenase PreA subunit